MAQDVLNICAIAISAVIGWFNRLVDVMGVGGLIFTAFCVVGLISMCLMPFRGSFAIGSAGVSFLEFSQGAMYRGKHYSGKLLNRKSDYKPKFEKRSYGGTRVSNRPR